MRRAVLVKLVPESEQHAALLSTMHTFNAACARIAEVAFAARCANKTRLQKMVYRSVREEFGLSAQMAVRAIAKVCEAFKRDRCIKPAFRPEGAMPYDPRILSWRDGFGKASVLTLVNRVIIPVRMADWQRGLLCSSKVRGQADLIYRGRRFYLSVVVEEAEPQPFEPVGILGVDLGIVNLAVDSDGTTYKGDRVDATRLRLDALRHDLQVANTRKAKKHVRKTGQHEARFRRDVNHCISKSIVSRARDTRRGIALEDLEGIRAGTTVRRSQRRRHLSWAYRQLRSFVAYKAMTAGVPVVLVPPRGTSHECPSCGHSAKANRPSRDEFRCVVCGRAGPADHIAAINIAARAVVNRPNGAERFVVHATHPPASSPAL